MYSFSRKHILAVIFLIILGTFGISYAAWTPIPSISNTIAVSGQVIKSSDINKMAQAINILDDRTQDRIGSGTFTLTSTNSAMINIPSDTTGVYTEMSFSVDKTGWYMLFPNNSFVAEHSGLSHGGYTYWKICTSSTDSSSCLPYQFSDIMPNTPGFGFFASTIAYLETGISYYIGVGDVLENNPEGYTSSLRINAGIDGLYLGLESETGNI